MTIKRFFSFFFILVGILISTYLWNYIKLPYLNYDEIIGKYSLQSHHKLNDLLRVTLFIAIPIFFYLIYLKYFNLNKIKFLDFISEFKFYKQENKKIVNNKILNSIFLISILFLLFNFFTTNFPPFKIDSVHEGQLLTSAYQNLETNTVWSKQYIQNSLFYDVIISKISFILYGEQSISSLRLNIIFLNLITDICLLAFSFLTIKLLNLTPNKEIFFFTLIFSVLLTINRSLHEWWWPVRFRDIPLILSLIIFIFYILNDKKNYLKLFLLGALSASSLLWSLDKGLYLNIMLFIFIFYLFLNKKIHDIFIFLFGVTSIWLIFYVVAGPIEFKSFFINTISLIDQRDYIMGLIYPEPFFDNTKHGTRATKYLLIIILNTVLIINIFQDLNAKKEIKIFLFFLLVLSCLNYVGGISRSDSYHLKQGIFFHNLTLSIIVIYYIAKIRLNFDKYNKYIFTYISLIIIFFVSVPKVKEINNPLSFTDRYNKYLNLDDSSFLKKNYISFLNFAKEKTILEECIQVLSYDISLNYLLKKKSCSNFTNPFAIGSKRSQMQFIEQLKKNNTRLVILEGPLSGFDPVGNLSKRLPYINNYLQNNHIEELKFMEWKIIFLSK